MLSFRSSKALVEVKQILFPCLFGVSQPLIDTVETLVYVIETILNTLDELVELLSPHVFFRHFSLPP